MPKMRTLRRFVRAWLSQNSRRFRYAPAVVPLSNERFGVVFRAVSQRLLVVFFPSGDVHIEAWFRGRPWDHLSWLDLYQTRARDRRYYCRLCHPPARFKTWQKLWSSHTLEPMLEWANKRIHDTTWLCLMEYKGTRWADLRDAREMPTIWRDPNYRHAFPLVPRPGRPGRSSDDEKRSSGLGQ